MMAAVDVTMNDMDLNSIMRIVLLLLLSFNASLVLIL